MQKESQKGTSLFLVNCLINILLLVFSIKNQLTAVGTFLTKGLFFN